LLLCVRCRGFQQGPFPLSLLPHGQSSCTWEIKYSEQLAPVSNFLSQTMSCSEQQIEVWGSVANGPCNGGPSCSFFLFVRLSYLCMLCQFFSKTVPSFRGKREMWQPGQPFPIREVLQGKRRRRIGEAPAAIFWDCRAPFIESSASQGARNKVPGRAMDESLHTIWCL